MVTNNQLNLLIRRVRTIIHTMEEWHFVSMTIKKVVSFLIRSYSYFRLITMRIRCGEVGSNNISWLKISSPLRNRPMPRSSTVHKTSHNPRDQIWISPPSTMSVFIDSFSTGDFLNNIRVLQKLGSLNSLWNTQI